MGLNLPYGVPTEPLLPSTVCKVHGDIGLYQQGHVDSANLLVFSLDGEERAFCARCLSDFLSLHISPVEVVSHAS